MSILGKILVLLSAAGWLLGSSLAWAAGPFYYRLPRGPGVDPEAITVVGEPQTHHIVRYENMYGIARKYDLGFWELARFHRQLDHFYLPWDTDIVIPTQWVLPEDPNPPGYLINVAELRGYRFFPKKNEVRTYPLGLGVLDYKTPIGKSFRVQSRIKNPGWRIPPKLRPKYGMSFMPPGPDNPVGKYWLGLSHYGLHGTHMPMGVGRLVSHGCIRHYPEDIKELFALTPVGTTVKVIYEPVKFGYLRGRIFVEVHEDIYHRIPDMFKYALHKLEVKGLAARINWVKFLRAVEERTGAPVDITRPGPVLAEPGF
ncbi:MAG: L,D-transpeptidase family protein [Deltaproteobacteria bacterium]|nr:L,D-transpeptidase family protein [Deltaproteobacteria bacterium]